MVFQQALLLPWLRVLSNVLLAVDVQGRNRKQYEARAHALIEMVGLKGFEDRLPKELRRHAAAGGAGARPGA